MNEREETMLSTPKREKPAVQAKAHEAAATAISLAAAVKAPLRPIGDQTIRAAASVAANIAEGEGRVGRDRIHHWRIAYGSAKEVDVHLRLLVAVGAIDPEAAGRALALFDEVRAMLWRMIRRVG